MREYLNESSNPVLSSSSSMKLKILISKQNYIG